MDITPQRHAEQPCIKDSWRPRSTVSAVADAYVAGYDIGTAKNKTTETGALRLAIKEMGIGNAEAKDIPVL